MHKIADKGKNEYDTIIKAARKKEADILNTANSTYDTTIKAAHEKEEVILHNAKTQLTFITSEINKKDFYIREIDSIKDRINGLNNVFLKRKHEFEETVSEQNIEIDSLEKKIASRKLKIDHLMSIQKSVNNSVKKYLVNSIHSRDEIIDLPIDVIRDVDKYAPSIILKLHNMDYRDLRKAFNANEKIISDTLKRYENRYTTKTNRAIYQLMVIALKAELQNVLYTLNYSKLNDAIATIRDIMNKYLNIVREGNQTISSTLLKFIGELEYLFIDDIKIEYEYYAKREAARQEQLALREQMRQEAVERARLEEQRKQIEQEEQKYKDEIQNINNQLKVSDDAKSQQLLNRIKELENMLSKVTDKKEEIINLQNGKAGYVYIISNLGSFGDNVFKVGMTRRLDPQERIDELSNASVPFKFDVHSFIFSEDAVKLESELHVALEPMRINKVNIRKEFFKIPLDNIEGLVNKIEPTAEFNRSMIAEQYHQTLSLIEEKQNNLYLIKDLQTALSANDNLKKRITKQSTDDSYKPPDGAPIFK